MRTKWVSVDQVRAALSGLAPVVLILLATAPAHSQGIVIEDEDWEAYTSAEVLPVDADLVCDDRATPASPYAFVCDTDDGAVFMAMRGRCPTITYTVNVTSLPESGETRFPIELSGRRIETPSGGNLNIHNETTGSVISMGISYGSASADVTDDVGEGETLFFDPQELPGGGLYDSTDPGDGFGREPSLLRTERVTLEMAEGENVIRFDGCIPDDDGDHLQLFLLWIGPDEQGLDGSIAAGCSVVRTVDPAIYSPGDTVTVTLTGSNLAAGTKVTETVPEGMRVEDPGDGAVNAGEISFTLEGRDSVTYVLDTADACGVLEMSGSFDGGENCLGDVRGGSELRCIGGGGIRIDEDLFEGYATSDPEVDPVDACVGQIQICETVDGRFYLFPDTDPVRLFDIVYIVDVTQLPGAAEARVPVAIEARRIGEVGGVFGIRNATTDSWIGFNVTSGAGGAGSDDGARDTGLTGAPAVGGPTDSTDEAAGGTPPRVLASSQATLSLAPGINEIHIENFGSAGPGSDDGDVAQVFSITIGAGIADVMGEPVVPCFVRRAISPSLVVSPSEVDQFVEVTLTGVHLSGDVTVNETIPGGWTVTDAGGGEVNGNQVTIPLPANSDGVTYTIRPPDPLACAEFEIAGTFAGEGDCSGDVTGTSTIRCREPLEGIIMQVDVGDGPCLADLDDEWFCMRACDTYEDVLESGVDVVLETGNPDACRSREPPAAGVDPALQEVADDLLFANDAEGPPAGDFIIKFVNLPPGVYELESFHFRGDENPAVIQGVEIEGARVIEAPDEIVNGPETYDDPPLTVFEADGDEVSIRFIAPTVDGPSPHQAVLNGFILATGACRASETPEVTCDDGVDNDCDGLADGADSDCGVGPFHRGECNDDGRFDLSDAVCTLNWLFQGVGSDPICLAALDIDGGATVNLTDAVLLLTFLFQGGAALPAPFPDCGSSDLASDKELGCEMSPRLCR